ncbi:coproporphyrinogen III oxidase family protein [Campylobacter concisus]|uniref:coproporphyrinogen III oxidase family protein n=1 Tax=Campylobacter concisus TaxID=199 RepID=UPI000CD94DCE|nr:coproporphyrinogen III oxidase family protein [Campylobacter concisus]QPH87362.1 coproporphyrinogen III oxidase family protein [Campylobacter concisus]QPI02310.1 coproporphyrinogen III oxidase family protein [Campylobacter concisus]
MIFKNIVENFAVNYAHNSIQRSLYNEFNIDILTTTYTKTPKKDKKYMLYAHVPFCHTFCPYCSFHKYHYEQELAKIYFENLREEMRQVKEAGFDFDSLYVGGGTTLINEPELEKTLKLAKDLFSIDEISAESDPNHISPESLARFDGLIDRLSVGVQSFDDETLKRVGRYEKFGSAKEIKRKLELALGKIPVISLDLIFNLPNQTKEQLINDINTAKSIYPQQITFYPLMKSELTRENIARSLGVSNVDNEREFYEIITEEFSKSNYKQSNAWAFSNEKSADLRDEYVGSNLEYLGVGSGAFSFLNGELVINAFNLLEYGKRIKNRQSPVIAKCGFSEKERLKYTFLTRLFDGGVDIKRYNDENNTNINKALFMELSLLKLVNAIYEENGIIKPTFFGKYICIVLMRDFYAGMDKVRAIFKDDAKIKRSKVLRIMSENTEQKYEPNIIQPRAAI